MLINLSLVRLSILVLITFTLFEQISMGGLDGEAEDDDEDMTTQKPMKKSRTTPTTTVKPKHQGKHKLVDGVEANATAKATKKVTTKPTTVTPPKKPIKTIPKPKPVDLDQPKEKVTPKPAATTVVPNPPPTPEQPKGKAIEQVTENLNDKNVTSPPKIESEAEKAKAEPKPATTTVVPSPPPTPEQPKGKAIEQVTENLNDKNVTSPPKIESEAAKAKAEALKGRSAIGETIADPFSYSREWALFNGRMDNLTILLIEAMKPAYSAFTDKNEEYKGNKSEFLDSFIKNFNEKYLKRPVELLQPVQDELIRNEVFSVINPVIGLRTIADVIALAKENPSEENDKGRLKWIEVNSMAATIHHIYERLVPTVNTFELEQVPRTVETPYPSWVTDSAIKENENTYKDMTPETLMAYVHEQMNILGEPHHLIRILERLLNNTALSNWDPSKTSLNMYCYGNNRNGLIHQKFDVLTDAALYLVLADMKFAILNMTANVYSAWKVEKENGIKVDLEIVRNEIETTLKKRLERKYRIALDLGGKDIEKPIAPKRFKCDHPPKSCGELPHATAPNCPPGIYIQDGSVFNNGTKLTLPDNPSSRIMIDGNPIQCIGLEFIPYDESGVIIPCYVADGKCLNPLTEKVLENLKIVLTPILLDENGVPINRDNRVQVYPKSSEWGIMNCEIHPDSSVLDPPQGQGNCKNKIDNTNDSTILPICGYEDSRNPNTSESAQFSNAFPGYLESELVLSSNGKCIGTCRNYQNPTRTCTNKTSHCDLYRKSHCEDPGSDCMKASKCPNQAKRCIRTSRKVNFCPAKEGSGKLYDWLIFNDKIHRGGVIDAENDTFDKVNPTCNGNEIMKLRERWEMESGVILNTPEYCELCLCICTDPLSPDGQHYFDITPRLADLGNSFVVTGLRFEQKNNTMSLNIQQGKLLENGKIDDSTVTWLESPPTQERVPLGSNGFLRINLDEVIAKFTEVVTGIRWIQNGETLSLEVGVTEYISKPPSASSKINFIKNQFPIRQKFTLTEANSPYNQGGPSQPYPITDESKYYIEFDATSLEKDAGQSVVPFFDLQPILSSDRVPVPLSAVGILFKSKEGSGGFLAPTVRTFVHPYIRDLE